MSTLDILTNARELISDCVRWTKLANARDEKGIRIAPHDHMAVSWCAIGAVTKFTSEAEAGILPSERALQSLCVRQLNRAAITILEEDEEFGDPAMSLNDSRSHDDVLAMFDLAIENVRNETPA